jgi:hypothetical protein
MSFVVVLCHCPSSLLQMHPTNAHDIVPIPSSISNVDNVDPVEHLMPDECNSNPCYWNRYGPDIMSHMQSNYAGLFLDNAGNVVDDTVDSATIVTNHHLRFLSYSAFTAAKDGYLGKKRRIPLPISRKRKSRKKSQD